MDTIDIRQVDTIDEIKQIEGIQRDTWHMDDLEVIPARFMHALRHNGACLYGAYDGEKMVGFVFGLLAAVEGLGEQDTKAAATPQMYSAIMGVLPDYQVRGIGYRLKLAQREFALRARVRLITWTFDPLESRNAYLNIQKLGVVCRRYLRDFHGDMGGINAGLPTDRFHIDWWVSTDRVQARLAGRSPGLDVHSLLRAGTVLVNKNERQELDLAVPPADFSRVADKQILVEIPADFQTIKERDFSLAKAWRAHSRSLFEYYFGHGYLVTDFAHCKEPQGRSRSYYLLSTKDS